MDVDPIRPAELGVDEDLGLRVLAVARSIAPSIDTLTSPFRESVVATLRGVAKDAARRGSTAVKAQRMGPASADYWNSSWFSDDDRDALRATCAAAAAAAAGPVAPAHTPIGSFPTGDVVARLWPETYE